MSKFGTAEWAEVNKNIYLGCKHDCKYCYARYNAITRFKTIKNKEAWKEPILKKTDFFKKPTLFKNKRIMYPTQHDIHPEHLKYHIKYLKGLLQVGNSILIVSKPHLECIKAICDEFEQFKKQIVFRFTIGSPNNDVLKFWEPGATNYEERKESLKYAFEKGFQTSVSCEPVLDEDIGLLIHDLLPFITDTIWIGKMNFIRPRVNTSTWKDEDWQYMDKVKVVIKDEFILDLYDEFKDNAKVKWKESIKKVLGLPEEEGVA